VIIVKKNKEITQEDLEQMIPIIELENCAKCNNTGCKCIQIMEKMSECIDLADQICHIELYNILLTIYVVLQHLDSHGNELKKIMDTCQEVFKELNPKEMGQILN